MAVAKNGDLYFSHSTSDYNINEVAISSFPNPSGRLIHYSRKTGQMKVLLDKLWFGNGIALSIAEDFVIVNDSFSSRMMKVWLTGSKKGSSEVFYEGLPGAPDNLSFDEEGIWVPIATAADDSHPMIPHKLANFPIIRKFTIRLLELVVLPFKFVDSFYPTRLTKYVCRGFGSMDMFKFIFPARRTVLRLDWDGNVMKSYHGSDDSTPAVITHALNLDGYLYLGTVTDNFISRVKA